jgi:hypothetical protein
MVLGAGLYLFFALARRCNHFQTPLRSMIVRLSRYILHETTQIEGDDEGIDHGWLGFLGVRLARTLLTRGYLAGNAISELTLADLFLHLQICAYVDA